MTVEACVAVERPGDLLASDEVNQDGENYHQAPEHRPSIYAVVCLLLFFRIMIIYVVTAHIAHSLASAIQKLLSGSRLREHPGYIVVYCDRRNILRVSSTEARDLSPAATFCNLNRS